MEKDVVISFGQECVRAVLPRDIDHHEAGGIREKIDRALIEHIPRRLVLDFSRVAFMDSSGVGLIIGRTEAARKLGCTVELVGASESVMRLIRICGVERIKDLYIL